MGEEKYYYNLTTGEVEQGRVSPWHERMGPYDTHEEASQALERAQERNEEWQQEDEKWREEWEDDEEDEEDD